MTQSDHSISNLDNESVFDGPSLIYVVTSKIVICMQHAFFADIAMAHDFFLNFYAMMN